MEESKGGRWTRVTTRTSVASRFREIGPALFMENVGRAMLQLSSIDAYFRAFSPS